MKFWKYCNHKNQVDGVMEVHGSFSFVTSTCLGCNKKQVTAFGVGGMNIGEWK